FLVAIDLHTGKLRYATPLCIGQQELTMFGMMFQEFTASCTSTDGKTIYVCTNLGLAGAVDAATGYLRWLSEYKPIQIQPAKHYLKAEPRQVFWYNNPVIVDGNMVFVTPNDSEYLCAFEAHTGRQIWSHRARSAPPHPTLRYLLGVVDDLVILSGEYGLLALDRSSGRMVWEQSYAKAAEQLLGAGEAIDDSGRGFLAGGVVYVPTGQALLGFDVHTG